MVKYLKNPNFIKRIGVYFVLFFVLGFSFFSSYFSGQAISQTTNQNSNFQRPPFSIGLGETYNDNGTIVFTGFVDPRNLRVKTYFEYGLNTNFGNRIEIFGDITSARDVYGRVPMNKINQVRFVRFCGVANNGLVRCSNTEIIDVAKLKDLPNQESPTSGAGNNSGNNNSGGSQSNGNSGSGNGNQNTNQSPTNPPVVEEKLDPTLVARTEFLKSIGLAEADPLLDWFTVVTEYLKNYSEEGGLVIEINNQKETLSPLEYNSYRIAVGNAYPDDVKNATLIVYLPDDVDFLSADFGVYVPSRHIVIYSIDNIEAGKRISYFIHTQAVLKEGEEKIPQLAVAEISFLNPKVQKTTSVASYDVDNFYPTVPAEAITPAEKIANDLVALSFGSGSTSGMVMLMLLIIIIFIEIVILSHELTNSTRTFQTAYVPAGYPNRNNFYSYGAPKNNTPEPENISRVNLFEENNSAKEPENSKNDYFGHLGL